MGFPDLQDGRPPPGSAGAELTAGPVPAEKPDEDTTGHPTAAPGTETPPWRATSPAGARPAGRAGAHRRSLTSPQKQPWPAAPTVTGPQDRSQSPSRTVTSARDGSPPPRRPPGDGHPVAGAPGAPATTGPQARHGRRPGPSADGLDEDGGLAITREAPGTRHRTAPRAGTRPSGARRGPLRGFPPAPGQPGPVYPPGQFSPWNRASTRSAWLGVAGTGGGTTDTDPEYSALAVSDAAADLTATQSWSVIDGEPPANPAAPPRGGTDWGSHSGEPPWQRDPDTRDPDARASATQAPGDRAPGSRDPGNQAAARSEGAATGGLAPPAFGAAGPARRSRAAASASLAVEDETEPPRRRTGKRGRRRTALMTVLLLTPVLLVLVVVAGYVYLSRKHSPAPAPTAAPSRPTAEASSSSSPAPTLGRWKHIESRSQDPVPLTKGQLFPAKFASGGAAGTLAISQSGTRCSHEVFGSKLAAAIRKAKCTQVLRASYLSTDRKIMATVGVLNLADVAAAEKAGKAAGATEFIKQLPSRHGPTRNLAKGTGIEVAEVKGHYLILIWTEFANLHSPSSKSQRKKLELFSENLVAGTANVSLSNRMVTGHP